MKRALACFLISLLCIETVQARVARNGSSSQVAVQNRSSNLNQTANVNRNTNVNQNANINRNVNVNNNVNVNRNVNVDVHGGSYGGCCYHEDNNWNWGSFAAGAAVGVATTAVVAAATKPSTTTVVTTAAPTVGSVVTALPGGCASVSTGGA